MKKYFATILFVLMLVAMPIAAYATEGAPPSGKANVKFYITDETTDGYPGSAFSVTMKDNTGTTDSYHFTKGNSWGNNRTPVYTMTAPATYTVTVEGMESGYALIDTLTRDENITFETVMGGNPQVLWSIIKKESDLTKNEAKEESTNLQKTESKYTVSNEEADKIYQNFLSVTAFIANDTEWKNNFLQTYSLFPHAERYAAYVEGGTEDEYLAMSLYDRFAWSETYLKYAWAVNTGSFSDYFGSKENFQNHITNDIVNMMKNIPNSQKVIDAYLALADWQYDYVKTNGVPFNFINNRSYLEEVRKGEVEKEVDKDSSSVSDKKELSSAAKELYDDADDATKKQVKDKGIWDDTIGLISSNVITIGILVVILAACGIVVFRRRRKNVSDINNGDTHIDASDD